MIMIVIIATEISCTFVACRELCSNLSMHFVLTATPDAHFAASDNGIGMTFLRATWPVSHDRHSWDTGLICGS